MNSSRLWCSQYGPGRLPESGQISAETIVSGRDGAVDARRASLERCVNAYVDALKQRLA